jgi:hypothetical protein
MTASSSFMELKTSRPPSFHSPLSVVKTEEVRMQPCTEVASSLTKASVFCRDSVNRWTSCAMCLIAYSNIVQSPFDALLGDSLSLSLPAERSYTFSCNVDVRVCLAWRSISASRSRRGYDMTTSTVSRTFITPGCRRVRNLRRAFLASGRRDLFAVTSKEKMLQRELSS